MSESQKHIVAKKGRVVLDPHWRMVRREKSYSLPRAMAAWLQGQIRTLGNRDACGRVALFAGALHHAPGKVFVLCRDALAKSAALGLTARQIQRAVDRLVDVEFLIRVGGGEWDAKRRQRTPVRYRINWTRKWPIAGLRPKKDKLKAIWEPVLWPPSRGFRACGLIPVAGEVWQVRQAARAALDRLRGEPVPKLGVLS